MSKHMPEETIETKSFLEALVIGFEQVMIWIDLVGHQQAKAAVSEVLPQALSALEKLVPCSQASEMWLDMEAEIFKTVGDLCMKCDIVEPQTLKACLDIAMTTLSGKNRPTGDADWRYREALAIMMAKMASRMKILKAGYKPKDAQAEQELHEKLKEL